jgi:hypothetical protein
MVDAAWCGASSIQLIPAWVDINGVDRARNHAVKLAESVNADYLIMQDADTWVHGPCIPSLLATINRHRAAAVALSVALRNREGCNVKPAHPGETYLAELAGTGVMMIDMRDVADVPRPLFLSHTSADGLRNECGEDIYFCRKLREHGKLIAVDYTLTTSHATQDVNVLDPSNANTKRQLVETTAKAGTQGQ